MIIIEEKNSVKVPGKTSLFLYFPYKKELIDIVKNGEVAVYNKDDKTWEIPITNLQRFVDAACIFDDITIVPKKEEIKKDTKVQITEKFKSNLFDHQKEAILYGLKNDKWLLLDDPGLGKTATTICLAQQLKKDKNIEHCLVICGVNTLKVNWKREIEKHSNLSCKILGERINKAGKTIIGSVKERVEQLKNKIDEFFVITNIETIRSDDVVKGINEGANKFDMIVFDEVHTCFPKGTIISTDIGNLKIEDIVDNNINCKIYTYNTIKGQVELKNIVDRSKSYSNCLVCLTIEIDGKEITLQCTPDHLIWTNNRGYVKAIELDCEDQVEIFQD